MALTTMQLEELQTIAETIQDQFTENQDESWWAAIRIQNADLGPDGSGGQSAFDATLADISTTQQQINPYQSRMGGRDGGFREAVLQVVPSGGGGGGDNYYNADLVGNALNSHTHNGRDGVIETYLDLPDTGIYSKAASMYTATVANATNLALLSLDATNGTSRLLATTANGDAEVTCDDGDVEINTANQLVRIVDSFGGNIGLQQYDDIADATSNGLVDGDLFATTGFGSAPLDTEGIVMIVIQGA